MPLNYKAINLWGVTYLWVSDSTNLDKPPVTTEPVNVQYMYCICTVNALPINIVVFHISRHHVPLVAPDGRPFPSSITSTASLSLFMKSKSSSSHSSQPFPLNVEFVQVHVYVGVCLECYYVCVCVWCVVLVEVEVVVLLPICFPMRFVCIFPTFMCALFV